MALFSSKNTCRRMKEVHPASIGMILAFISSIDCNDTRVIFVEVYVSTLISVHPTSTAVKHASFSSLSLNGIDEIMIVSIKSYFLSHKGRRPSVRRPNGRAPKRRRPNAGAQTAAPKRRRPNGGAQTAAPKRPAPMGGGHKMVSSTQLLLTVHDTIASS